MSDRQSPASIALASRQGRRALWQLGLIACIKALGLVLVAEGIARGVVGLIEGRPVTAAVLTGVLGAVLRAAAVWASRTAGARAAIGVKTDLRAALVHRTFAGSTRDVPVSDGALTLAATRALDDLDDYFTAVLPALTGSAAIPLLIVARIAFSDWVSALIIVLTLPLVPVFMVLIGRYSADRIADATTALDRLSTALVELARGLPVLVGLGRVLAQTRALRDTSETYRDTTMQTLRVAFLSALALEFISTISVALVAVFIGVRLVYGTMELSDGLFALILAPECYLPLRQLGAAFHSTENGMAAFARVRALIGRPVAAPVAARTDDAGEGIDIRGLSVHYAGRSRAALRALDAHIPDPGLTVLHGPSGAGKSTLLGVLAGLVREDAGCRIGGTVRGVPERLAHAGQSPRTSAPTVAEELALHASAGGPRLDDAVLARCLAMAALAVDPQTPCAALSPGELRRLALARAFARVEAGARLLLVDEPTAHLDADSASTVRSSLTAVSRAVPVIAATHDLDLLAAGGTRIEVRPGLDPADPAVVRAGTAPHTGAAEPAGFDTARPPAVGPADATDAAGAPRAPETGPRPDVAPAAPSDDYPTAPEVPALPAATIRRRLSRAVDMRSPRFLLAVLCGVGAVAAGAALTGVSAWLIVHASFQPPIMYLLVAIVGVRFFGLARTVLKYAERLVLHRAILDSLTRLRERIWLSFAATGTANRTLLRGEVALSRLIADVDDVRDLAPRVVLPPVVAVVVALAAVVTLALIHPAAGLVMGLGALLSLGLAPLLTRLADRRATSAARRTRTTVLTALAGLLWAREDLQVNGAAPQVVERFLATDARAGAHEARAVRATGIGEAVITVVGVLTGVLMLPVLAGAVTSGTLSGELLAVAVLLPLALIDCFTDALASVQQWPALVAVLGRVDALDDADPAARLGSGDGPEVITDIELDDLAATWPGTDSPVFSGVSARIDAREWTTVTGPSGSGKTTLVSILLLFLDPSAGEYRINGRPTRGLGPMDLAGQVSWCPQEAHVFDSSLRANLLIGRPKDDAPTDAELRAVLTRVGLRDLAADAGLDARIGASGAFLSGGQRQRLAVARTLLAHSEVIVLDEPTAHLDAQMSADLMGDLRAGLDGVAVVLVSHDPGLVGAHDERIVLV
ncbi:thiol reductant ABC exporter subunit CydC [Brevibacterium sp. CS2]|uniref:thiol reductant ABC exporter subunit CydC n=1 Tax=Brevibacterium sp. CS2 TaxID=2575923 RepID=UPI0020C80D64|nr:thiol reductant ABC exporter subunit CydC [Brevibacterium sp. CS2]